MPTELSRLTITLTPDLLPKLDAVKREMFLNGSRADVIRYLIDQGFSRWTEVEKAAQ